MLSVNQMFYGTDEPVWLVDASSPSPVKYHYLGAAHREPRRSRDTYYPYDPYDDYYESPISDPYYNYSSVPRRRYSPPRSRSVWQPSYYNAPPPPQLVTEPYSSVSPPPASAFVPSVFPISPSYYNAPLPPPLVAGPYSSVNPPPAPAVVPSVSPISRTPVVDRPTVSRNTPYTLLLRVPICCEGCETRVLKKLLNVPGVISVRCDIERQSVTVRGTPDTDEVLREAKKAFKKSRLW